VWFSRQARIVLETTIHSLIAKGYTEGCLRYGDLRLKKSVYEDRILLIVQKHVRPSAPPVEAAGFVDKLHGPDLYLATACIQSNPGGLTDPETRDSAALAWSTLEKRYKKFVADSIRVFKQTNFAIADLADTIFADLYLPDRSGFSRIASYDGRSSLSTWLRAVVSNRVINIRQSIIHSQSANMTYELPDEPALGRIDSAVRTRRYQRALQNSLQMACRVLTPQERLMVLWRYEEGIKLGQIAQRLGIHQSNVTRQLVRVQNKLREEATSILAKLHGLSEQAIRECIEDAVDNPRNELSILDLIRNASASSRSTIRSTAGPDNAACRREEGIDIGCLR
jgi:RNA polymerase sigma-70 factor